MSHVDPLFAGLTRPATLWGVTYAGLILNAMYFGIIMITQAYSYTLLCIPIHLAMMLICWKEPRFFELIVTWIKTKGADVNRTFWKSSTYGP